MSIPAYMTALADNKLKVCTQCTTVLSPINCSPSNWNEGHYRCNACNAKRTRYWYHSQDGKRKQITKRYNISLEQYSAMVVEQNGLCAICKSPANGRHNTLCVDHNHDTGQVRGLLCHSCNTSLGAMKDSVVILASAIQYLMKYSNVSEGLTE